LKYEAQMEIKKILSNTSHWTINKELSKKYGLHATLLLQHLIDLRFSFFKKGTPFYQQQSRLSKDLDMSEYQIRQATKVLIEADFISVKRVGIPPKYEYSIKDVNLYRFFNLTFIDEKIEPLKVKNLNHKHKELTEHKELTNTNMDEKKSKIFFKIVEAYPTSKIGNRNHALQKFTKLEMEECKLAATNLKRYLNAVGQYTHALNNYIDQKCFTEKWLTDKETFNKNKNKNSTIDVNHNFSGDYGIIN